MTSRMTGHIDKMSFLRTYHDTSSWKFATSQDMSVTTYGLHLIFINDVIDDVIEIKITKWRMKSYLGIIAYQNNKQKHESHGLF